MQLKQNTMVDEKPTEQEALAAVETLLKWIGEKPSREGLVNTPKRVLATYQELFAGYQQDPAEALLPLFCEDQLYEDMVLVKAIAFESYCEHHMMPIIGHIDLAYVPMAGVVGLSKFARLVDVFSKRLQTQERLTEQLISSFSQHVPNQGVAIQVKAAHDCMRIRGVKRQDALTVTQSWRGCFQDSAWQSRFLTSVS